MNFTHFLITLFAGIIGTIAMTAFMYLFGSMAKKDTKVLQILGAMMTGTKAEYSKAAFIAGTFGHFGVGILFSFSYFLLWNWGVFQVNLVDSLIIGAISGIVAIAVWRGYFWLHHNPPKINLTYYSVALFLAHIVFGLVTVLSFNWLMPEPDFYYMNY